MPMVLTGELRCKQGAVPNKSIRKIPQPGGKSLETRPVHVGRVRSINIATGGTTEDLSRSSNLLPW